MRKFTVLPAVFAILLMAPAAHADKISNAAAAAAPMTASDLAQVYSGKTWVWGDGAGYFARDRRFVGWSGTGDAATYATGRWSVTDAGRLCFRADWRSKSTRDRSRTCFNHRQAGKTIYQRKDPSGAWYVFRSSRPRSSDEYSKLKRGDLASAGVKKVRSQIE